MRSRLPHQKCTQFNSKQLCLRFQHDHRRTLPLRSSRLSPAGNGQDERSSSCSLVSFTPRCIARHWYGDGEWHISHRGIFGGGCRWGYLGFCWKLLFVDLWAISSRRLLEKIGNGRLNKFRYLGVLCHTSSSTEQCD